MAMFYLIIFLLPHLISAEVPQDTCSQEEPGKLRNSQALLQVAAASIHKHSVAIQHGQPSRGDSYNKTVEKCCVTDMMEFIREEIETQHFFVCSEGSLAGMALWHDCANDNSSYAGVLAGIEKGKTGKCKWIGNDPNCAKPPVEECGGFTGTLPPCRPTCSQNGGLEVNFLGTMTNNLAKAANEERELRFSDVARHPTTNDLLDLVVLSSTPDPNSLAAKSDDGSMGNIRVMGGSKMELTFILAKKGSRTPYSPEPAELQFTFLDIDSSVGEPPRMTEIYYFDKNANLVMEKDAEVSVSKDPNHVTITSTKPGPGCNNPTDPMKLKTLTCTHEEGTNREQEFTTNQRLRAVMLVLKDSSKFTLTLESTCDDSNGIPCSSGRRFLFAGKSSLSDLCPE